MRWDSISSLMVAILTQPERWAWRSIFGNRRRVSSTGDAILTAVSCAGLLFVAQSVREMAVGMTRSVSVGFSMKWQTTTPRCCGQAVCGRSVCGPSVDGYHIGTLVGGQTQAKGSRALIRALDLPSTKVVNTGIELARGPQGWPSRRSFRETPSRVILVRAGKVSQLGPRNSSREREAVWRLLRLVAHSASNSRSR